MLLTNLQQYGVPGLGRKRSEAVYRLAAAPGLGVRLCWVHCCPWLLLLLSLPGVQLDGQMAVVRDAFAFFIDETAVALLSEMTVAGDGLRAATRRKPSQLLH